MNQLFHKQTLQAKLFRNLWTEMQILYLTEHKINVISTFLALDNVSFLLEKPELQQKLFTLPDHDQNQDQYFCRETPEWN